MYNPERPTDRLPPEERELSPLQRLPRAVRIGAAFLLALAIYLAWRHSPLPALAHPDRLREVLAMAAESPMAPLLAIGAFAVVGVIVFPMSVLIIITAATFGAGLGFLYSATGAVLGATLGYVVGRWLGRNGLKRIVGTRINRIARRLARRGILTVATVRLVPFAPYAVINMVAGASRVRYVDYIIGSALGKLPGMIVLSILGDTALDILLHPTPTHVALFAAYILAWLLVSLGVQHVVERLRRASF